MGLFKWNNKGNGEKERRKKRRLFVKKFKRFIQSENEKQFGIWNRLRERIDKSLKEEKRYNNLFINKWIKLVIVLAKSQYKLNKKKKKSSNM